MVRKQKWSNQKIARNLMFPLVGILVLLVAGVGAFCLLNQPKPTLFSVGQALEMSVEQDQETAVPIFGYTAGFPWASGTVRLTMDSTHLYSSIEALTRQSSTPQWIVPPPLCCCKLPWKMWTPSSMMG